MKKIILAIFASIFIGNKLAAQDTITLDSVEVKSAVTLDQYQVLYCKDLCSAKNLYIMWKSNNILFFHPTIYKFTLIKYKENIFDRRYNTVNQVDNYEFYVSDDELGFFEAIEEPIRVK